MLAKCRLHWHIMTDKEAILVNAYCPDHSSSLPLVLASTSRQGRNHNDSDSDIEILGTISYQSAGICIYGLGTISKSIISLNFNNIFNRNIMIGAIEICELTAH